ncbi:hypothetical protein DFP73DRAFT_536423 [Morchella snyderi]|nr:hypothetical protein DFP73DRAFT_536423 [Morchella snyderi]
MCVAVCLANGCGCGGVGCLLCVLWLAGCRLGSVDSRPLNIYISILLGIGRLGCPRQISTSMYSLQHQEEEEAEEEEEPGTLLLNICM